MKIEIRLSIRVKLTTIKFWVIAFGFKSIITLENGAVYTGEWLGNEKDGFGIQNWLDGS